MKKVFISGSRSISRLNTIIKKEIDCLIEFEYRILIGDANGVDKKIQEYLSEINYIHVLVYHVGDTPRNNIGNWKMKQIHTTEKPGTREYFTEKDIEMSYDCDYSFVVWDEKSKGSLSNIKRILQLNKKTRLHLNKSKIIYTINNISDMSKIGIDLSVFPIQSLELELFPTI